MIITFLFFNKARGIQSLLSFSRQFKHVSVLMHYDGFDVLLDTKPGRITHRVYKKSPKVFRCRIKNLKRIKSLIAILSIQIEEPEQFKPIMPLIMTCNEVARNATGLNIGFTFNPKHLYNKLTKIRERNNFIRLYEWRRNACHTEATTKKVEAITHKMMSFISKSSKMMLRLLKNNKP